MGLAIEDSNAREEGRDTMGETSTNRTSSGPSSTSAESSLRERVEAVVEDIISDHFPEGPDRQSAGHFARKVRFGVTQGVFAVPTNATWHQSKSTILQVHRQERCGNSALSILHSHVVVSLHRIQHPSLGRSHLVTVCNLRERYSPRWWPHYTLASGPRRSSESVSHKMVCVGR